MVRYLLILGFFFFLLSCGTSNTPINKFSDPEFVRIAEFQDHRFSDSLFQYFSSENPRYREAAALAFASIQDSLAIEALGKLFINDSDAQVREAAAFALGQTGGLKSFRFLNNAPETNKHDLLVSEGLGKTISIDENSDIILSSWGLYRRALRGPVDSTYVQKAISFLSPQLNESDRLGAAHFFGRSQVDITKAESSLVNVIQQDTSPYIRMAAASALRKIKTPGVLQYLTKMYSAETDYRVRINILRALQPYSFKEVSTVLFEALNDENVNVAIASSEVIKQIVKSEDYQELVVKARTITNWRVKANLYEAAMSATSNKELSEEIIKIYNTSVNDYEKASLLGALTHSPMQFQFVSNQLLTSAVPVIRTSATTSLHGMNKHRLFEASMQSSFLEIYKKALILNDAAVIGIIASILSDSVLGYKSVINDIQFLYDCKEKLTLPKDNEALQPLEAAIAFFEGSEIAPLVKNDFNHPIDWEFVKSIPSNQHVLIRTVKGDIEIRLFVDEAPGSVANFLELAQAGYFNNKNFHRVVPNFVIQGGCNRGDGWGSEDYSIRSEFSLRRYKEGSVGMASAGKDTEGTQWFITHSPTPHLDGRYTIFAEVNSGMEVVHQIEVGDKILSVETLKN